MIEDDASDPGAPKIFSGTTLASGATPTTPIELSLSAATVPETCVPWKLPCVSTLLSPLTKSHPSQSSVLPLRSSSMPLVSRAAPRSPALPVSWPARSGCVLSTPVSTTATTAPAPFVFAHASGASMSASAVPKVHSIWPVLCRPHIHGNSASLDCSATIRSGSA